MSDLAGHPSYLGVAVDRLRAAFGDNLVGVVLYGSHARGEARPESDADLLVIAEGLPERRYDRVFFLQRLVRGIDGAPDLSLLGKTTEEFEGYFPSLYLDIGLDGVLLHDRDGYTAARLGRVREIIAQAGLSRRRLKGGLDWNWERPPQLHWEITWDGFRELA